MRAELINGTCPTCDTETILISLTPELFRCVTCGTDLRQYVNGKISYIPHLSSAKDIQLETNRDG
jgi:ribosomal protein S27E